MANTFKNITIPVPAGSTSGLSSPSNGTIVVIGGSVTNKGTVNARLDGYLQDSSTNDNAFFIAADIPPGGNTAFIGGDQKLVLENSDQVLFSSNVSGALDVVISYMLIN